MAKKIDYYEFLQISPHADPDTIHRVYRFLAARFHPDNSKSGDPHMFSMLTTIYDVLSNPASRAEYDASCQADTADKVPLSSNIDFMDNLDGETNRRLAVLAVLYFRRRSNPQSPEVSLTEIENRMGFPRDYLDFTTWYLLRKAYITRADNSDFTLTAQGVDFVETQRVNIPILNKLLTSGSEPNVGSAAQNGTAADHASTNGVLRNGVPGMALAEERRLTPKDRRARAQDRRATPKDRRAKALLPDVS